MSYARSPLALCSTTMGTRPMFSLLLATTLRRNHQGRLVGDLFLLDVGRVEKKIEDLLVDDGVPHAGAPLGRRERPVIGPGASARLGQLGHLLAQLLLGGVDRFLLRHR